MNKVIDWLKSIRLDRILTIFLVGVLVFVSTACSGGASAKTADEIREEVPGSALTSPYKGGMNDYSDVDPRANTAEAKAKAKALVDNAQKNIDEKSVDSTDQYVENYRSGTPLGERVKRIGENVTDSATQVTRDASKGTQENLRNAKATDTGEDIGDKIQQAAQDASDAVKSTVNKGVSNTKRTLNNAADAID